MADHTNREVTVLLNSDGSYYCCPAVARDGALWLSVGVFPKPVGPEWRYPNTFGVALIRGRDYVRRFTRMRLSAGRTETAPADATLVADWTAAAWWTPGLEEAWAELDVVSASPARGASGSAQDTTSSGPASDPVRGTR